ncbi:sulfotransferase 1B1-like [Eriocheir sinensis]|uniref:sulfotransferase 1B1-like n=1 Tax=Eriocheir sinensis TaxID=95602 RepID=UPI0021C6A464|nr:sulfotransferase 1B1-like [Eriocheir sinensis]
MADSTKNIFGLTMRRLPPLKIPVSCYMPDQVAVEPGNFVLPAPFEDWYPSYASLSILPDDIWVVTYPKTGTTWTQELVWCLLHDRNSPEAKMPLMSRFPFLEFDSLLNPSWKPDVSEDNPIRLGNSWKTVQQMTSPRNIKSHLPKDLLPPQLWEVKPKIVYVCRDPRDVCVSYYFHQRKLEGYTGSFEDFVETFLDDRLSYSPIWLHILDFWEMRNEAHILFLRYEDMKKDLEGAVRQVAAFLEVEVDDAEVASLVHHCSFDQMKVNPATNNETFLSAENTKSEGIKFMRKGQVGDWKNHMTEKQQEAFKKWTDRYLEGSDFPYYRDYE